MVTIYVENDVHVDVTVSFAGHYTLRNVNVDVTCTSRQNGCHGDCVYIRVILLAGANEIESDGDRRKKT